MPARLWLTLALAAGAAPDPGGSLWVRGMTISTQTAGREWATDGFGTELDELADLGVNWVAIHPYAGVRQDGTIRRWTGEHGGDEHVLRPIREARARGLSILIKPHLGYWGSGFSWRGDVDFPDPEDRARFWEQYGDWIVDLAELASEADAFVVGTELDRLAGDEAQWRALVERVRAVTEARLTYAANWDGYARVGFWDALDGVGVQGYFPLSTDEDPGRDELLAGWDRVLEPLRELHERTGKPVVLTELGYNCALDAAREPWSHRSATADERARASELQARCLGVALDVLGRERAWLRGAFLWKWFVGPAPGENFQQDTPRLRAVIRAAWAEAR